MNSNKVLAWIVGIIVVVLAIWGITRVRKNNNATNQAYQTPTQQTYATPAATTPPVISFNLTGSSCTGTASSSFDVLRDSAKVASVTLADCKATAGKVLAQNDSVVYFTILPGTIPTGTIYGKYNNLYKLTLADNSVTPVDLKLNNLTDMDFSSDLKQLVFARASSAAVAPAIMVRDLTANTDKSYARPR